MPVTVLHEESSCEQRSRVKAQGSPLLCPLQGGTGFLSLLELRPALRGPFPHAPNEASSLTWLTRLAAQLSLDPVVLLWTAFGGWGR